MEVPGEQRRAPADTLAGKVVLYLITFQTMPQKSSIHYIMNTKHIAGWALTGNAVLYLMAFQTCGRAPVSTNTRMHCMSRQK